MMSLPIVVPRREGPSKTRKIAVLADGNVEVRCGAEAAAGRAKKVPLTPNDVARAVDFVKDLGPVGSKAFFLDVHLFAVFVEAARQVVYRWTS